MRRSVSLLLLPALALAACSDAGDAAPDVGGDEVVASFAFEGGFVPVEFTLTQVPQVVVYGDGTVIATAAELGTGLRQLRLDGGELSALHGDLVDALAGLPARVEPDQPLMVADAPDSVLVVATDTGLHEVRANAVGLQEGYPAALEAAQARLQSLAERVQRDGGERPLDRARLVVMGDDATSLGGGQPSAWPDGVPVPDDAATATFDAPAVVFLTGEELETLVADTGGPTSGLWRTDDGATYLVGWRQALPHEA